MLWKYHHSEAELIHFNVNTYQMIYYLFSKLYTMFLSYSYRLMFRQILRAWNGRFDRASIRWIDAQAYKRSNIRIIRCTHLRQIRRKTSSRTYWGSAAQRLRSLWQSISFILIPLHWCHRILIGNSKFSSLFYSMFRLYWCFFRLHQPPTIHVSDINALPQLGGVLPTAYVRLHFCHY